jgi:hypothetical protein
MPRPPRLTRSPKPVVVAIDGAALERPDGQTYFEEPELYAAELRAFFRRWRAAATG